MSDGLHNWAGNYIYKASRIARPESVDVLREVVRNARKVKAFGSRHCFNDIADSDEIRVSCENLPSTFEITSGGLTIDGGVTYGQICQPLHERGFALHNLASLPHISVVGAIATATHGSGASNRNLASAVSSLEFVDGRGELVTLRRGDKNFEGAVVSLGALGVVTKMTLDIEPTFDVRQDCFLDLSLADAALNFETIMTAGYSVSMFTDWSAPRINQIWIKSRLDREFGGFPDEFCGASRATSDIHPIAGVGAENCTPQMGVAGPWHDRLPHFKMGFTPSAGAELQSEYFVPRKRAVEALAELARLREFINPLLLVSEIRMIAADDLWLSGACGRDSVAFHFTWKQDEPAVLALLPKIESALAPFDARPHWGKLFTTPKSRLAALYPRFEDFRALMAKYDPQRKFQNAFLERCF